jgi:hypothetical protein
LFLSLFLSFFLFALFSLIFFPTILCCFIYIVRYLSLNYLFFNPLFSLLCICHLFWSVFILLLCTFTL